MANRRLVTLVSLLPALFLVAGSPASARTAASPEEISTAWMGRVQDDIRRAEYEVTWQTEIPLPGVSGAWHAPNRAHGLRTYFTERGIRVIPRTEEAPSWEWGLVLVGHGRGDALLLAERPRVAPDHNRVEYDRGAIQEWYVNDERGLEQGFTIAAPPEGPAGALRIELELTGTLSPVIAADGQAVDFATPEGVHAIHYAELKVTDARLQEVPAYMEGYARDGIRGIRIVMNDGAAVYPLTVDPLATSPAWMGESNQASAYYGQSVAAAGDVNGDFYGDVIVGAPLYDNGQVDEGRIYVYHGSAAGLSSSPAAIREINVAYTQFGRSVSTAGDVNGDGYSDVIVGAPYDDNGEYDEGRAYAFHGSASGIGASPSWIGEINEAQAQFGWSVSAAGDVNGDGYGDVVVGAPKKDYTPVPGILDSGAAYVYHGSNLGLPSSPSTWRLSNNAGSDFGASVAWAGDVNGDGYSDVIVGAHLAAGPGTRRGEAYLYAGSATGPNWDGMWAGVGEQDNSEYGHAVATAGDVNGDGYSDIIVSAKYYANGQAGEGKVYVYHGSSLGAALAWSQEGNNDSAFFGQSVGTAGDVNGDGYADVVIGAYGYTNDLSHEGRAYMYLGSSSGLLSWSTWIREGDQAAADYGVSVATAGDVNGDGYSDVIVGAWKYDNGQTDEGAAFLYLGSASGLGGMAMWVGGSPQATARYGFSVASAGDVNGDGYADVVVGAPLYDNGQSDEGRVFVYHGSSAGPPAANNPSWYAESNLNNVQYGFVVASAGDVNGDGYSDLLLGSPNYNSSWGGAWVYYGSSTGLDKGSGRVPGTPSNADWTKPDLGGIYSNCGKSVASAGDVNGDGYVDVAVGCPGGGGGEVQVYYGSASGLPAAGASWTAHKDESGAQFGYAVASAGDVNRDGYSDLVAGTYWGWAYVLHGSGSGLDQFGHRPSGGSSQAADWTATAGSMCFGCAVASAGDVNGDGYADVVIGAPYYSDVNTNQGAAFVYHGSATGLDKNGTRPVGYAANADWWRVESTDFDAEYGISAATAGDVNGDGYADLVVGAVHTKTACVYHGSAAGLATTPSWTFTEGGSPASLFGNSVASAGDVNGDGYADVIVGDWWYDTNGRASIFYGNEFGGKAMRPSQRRYDDTGQISPLGKSEYAYGFGVRMIARTPFGRSRAKIEYEVKPTRTLFDGANTALGPTWFDTFTSGNTLVNTVNGVTQGTVFHWRARVRYDPARTPLQLWSRWITVPWNGWQEADLRTPCTLGAPTTTPNIWDASKSGTTVTITWNMVGNVDTFDVVAGTLGWLRSTGGDFNLAVDRCLGADTALFSASDASVPAAGDGYFYVLRGANCGGVGSYDDGSASQQGDRDAEINECP